MSDDQRSQPPRPPAGPADRAIDFDALTRRLQALNPHLTAIRAEPPTQPEAQVRISVETTRAELRHAGGKLRLADPALDRLRIETAVRFLDQKPGEQIRLRLQRSTDLDIPLPGAPKKKRFDA